MSLFVKSSLFIIILILSIFVFLFWASRSSVSQGFSSQSFSCSDRSITKATNELNLMSWNIAYAYGEGSEGSNYHVSDKEHYFENLDSIANEINQQQPDIVFLQEVDFDSSRSHHIDQLQYLAAKTKFGCIAYARSWVQNYIPFPYWPIKNHFKKINSGGAILSRFKIKDNRVFLHHKPHNNPWWYNLFYLYRYTQIITLEINDKDVVIFNNHLESFDKNNRNKQALKVVDLVNEYSPLIVAGDFNSVYPAASKKSHFTGFASDDYENDPTISIISNVLKPMLSETEYLQDEKRWFTFSPSRLDRKLDYIFLGPKLKVKKVEVIQNNSSDHLPLMGITIFNEI